MKNVHFLISFLVFFTLSANIQAANEQTPVHISLEKLGNFEIVHARSTVNGTGAAIGGLLGAAIEEGVRSSADEKKQSAILPLLSDPTCHQVLVNSIFSKLDEKDYNYEKVPYTIKTTRSVSNKSKSKKSKRKKSKRSKRSKRSKKSKQVLKSKNINLPDGHSSLAVSINTCGFKIVNSATKAMSSFVGLKIVKVKDGIKTKETLYITGKNEFLFEELLELGDTAEKEFHYPLRKAGRRIANKIIYN